MDISTSSPSEQGVAPEGVLAFIDALEAAPNVEPHGLIIQRHGVRIAEMYWAPHSADRSRLVYSISKTFTGTALALQIGEGRLSLDDLVADHLPDLLSGTDEITRRMQIRHIASMSSGHDREMIVEAFIANPTDPLRGFFSIPPNHEPGTMFAYSQPPVLALATILQRLAGSTLTEYLRPRLLEPLGISNFSWQQFQAGIDLGFSGVHTNLDAVARLGQLHLDNGAIGGRQILPADWVPTASSPQIANPQQPTVDWQQGYGMQMWMSQHGYRGDGAFGQYMMVLPEHDAVVAIFSETNHMQDVLDAAWTHLLPAMGDHHAAAVAADRAVADRSRGASIPTARQRTKGTSFMPVHARFVPAAGATHTQLTLTAADIEGDQLVLHEGDASIRLSLGDDWTLGSSDPIAASASQQSGCIAIDLAFVATPHRLELTLDSDSSTFTTSWATQPLVRASGDNSLSGMRSPLD